MASGQAGCASAGAQTRSRPFVCIARNAWGSVYGARGSHQRVRAVLACNCSLQGGAAQTPHVTRVRQCQTVDAAARQRDGRLVQAAESLAVLMQVEPTGRAVEWVDSALPQTVQRELLWAWRAVGRTTCARSVVVLHNGECLLHAGLAEAGHEAGKARPGKQCAEVMQRGKASYLASLALFPGMGISARHALRCAASYARWPPEVYAPSWMPCANERCRTPACCA